MAYTLRVEGGFGAVPLAPCVLLLIFTSEKRLIDSMGKLIALIVSILMLLAGIVMVAVGKGIGLLLLIAGMLGAVMMGIFLGASGGSVADFLTPRGFFDPAQKTKTYRKKKPENIWDEMSSKKS